MRYSCCVSTTTPSFVSEPSHSRPHRADRKHSALTHRDRRSLFERVVEFLHPGPESTDELIESLADAEHRDLIEPQSRVMLEGVIRMADMTAGDVMVASRRIDFLDIDQPYEQLLAEVIDTGHSRFPVFEGSKDNIIGVLMTKDLLKLQRAPELNLRTLLRQPLFVPESKGLNELLRDFRANRSHLAIVIDEFGTTAGLITIEDVLEEIVGEIEDEFDDEASDFDRRGERGLQLWFARGRIRHHRRLGLARVGARAPPWRGGRARRFAFHGHAGSGRLSALVQGHAPGRERIDARGLRC